MERRDWRVHIKFNNNKFCTLNYSTSDDRVHSEAKLFQIFDLASVAIDGAN